MKLVTEGKPHGSDPLNANTPSFKAEAEAEIMLTTFEAELDALIDMLGEDRKRAVSEALIRRYATSERIYENLRESIGRIELKMLILEDRLVDGFSGRNILEGAGEPDQETAGE